MAADQRDDRDDEDVEPADDEDTAEARAGRTEQGRSASPPHPNQTAVPGPEPVGSAPVVPVEVAGCAGDAVGAGATWSVHPLPSQYRSLPSGVGYHPAGALIPDRLVMRRVVGPRRSGR